MTGLLRSLIAWTWVLVAGGIGLRLAHVLRDPPLWHDEAALVLNAVTLDTSECFGPLLHHEAAPPLFLLLERLTLLALGDSELALRLPVLLVACGSLVMFARLAYRVCAAESAPGASGSVSWAAVLAVGLFAVSDRLIWHAAEAKPYAMDAFVAVLVAWGYVRTRELPLRLQCAMWSPLLPVAEWLTFPGCFVAGGLLLVLLPDARRASWPDRLAYLALGLTVVGSFAALALGPATAQQDGAMTCCWVRHFADWSQPASVPVWAVASTTEVLRYAVMPVGQFLLPLAVVGAVRLGRRDGRLLTVLLAPLGLALVAALAGKYPYGGARVCAFAAPALIVLVAEGTPPCWAWLRRRSRFGPGVLAIALALPAAKTAYVVVFPWPRADFREAVAFVEPRLEEGDVIASDHWEVCYYTRHYPERVCDFPEITERQPAHVWVLTGTDPGIAETRIARVPAGWERLETWTFRGTIAVRFDRRPPADSTSAGGPIP